MEAKQMEDKDHLCLDQFEYVDASDDDDDEKKISDNDNDDSGNTTVIEERDKGVRLKTFGIETDDPWSLGDDYKEWDTETTATWVRELNDSFDEYGDTLEQCDLNGKNFSEFVMMSFWLNKMNILNEAHAKALAAACKYRMDEYHSAAQDEADKKESNANLNLSAFEEEAPAAFDIPAMDSSYLSPHLRVAMPQDSYAEESEGGEGGGPGFTDDEGGGDEEIAIAAVAAPAAPIMKHKGKRRRYFWHKVMLKEEELLNVHRTHGQYALKSARNDDCKMEQNEDVEEEYEWKEPDFDELLSKP
eukprot:79529_1